MSDLQRAIYDLEGKLTWAKECGNYFVDELIDFDVIDTALTALRDMMRRQEGCVNCEKRYWYFTDYRFNPNYCPNCGRSLEPVGNTDTLPTSEHSSGAVSKTESVGQGPETGGEDEK